MNISGIIFTILVLFCIVFMTMNTVEWLAVFITSVVKSTLDNTDKSTTPNPTYLGLKLYYKIDLWILVAFWFCFYKGFIE